MNRGRWSASLWCRTGCIGWKSTNRKSSRGHSQSSAVRPRHCGLWRRRESVVHRRRTLCHPPRLGWGADDGGGWRPRRGPVARFPRVYTSWCTRLVVGTTGRRAGPFGWAPDCKLGPGWPHRGGSGVRRYVVHHRRRVRSSRWNGSTGPLRSVVPPNPPGAGARRSVVAGASPALAAVPPPAVRLQGGRCPAERRCCGTYLGPSWPALPLAPPGVVAAVPARPRVGSGVGRPPGVD